MFHYLAVPVLHLFICIVNFLSLYVDELNDDDDDDLYSYDAVDANTHGVYSCSFAASIRKF